MNVIVCILPFLLAGACAPSLAESARVLQVSEQARSVPPRVGDASPVAARYGGRPREQASPGPMAARRLTPAELAELREQVRQQWLMQPESIRSAQSQLARRVAPNSLPGGGVMSVSGQPQP